ncbi:MAG: selenide, water dikinase SelD [Planctomycetaceae bacterium]
MKSGNSDEQRLPGRHLVLLGMGHTNAHILRMFSMQPIADTHLTCLSNTLFATYSGMLPATLAGQNSPEDMQIDLVRLCAKAGVRLINSEVTQLDPVSRTIRFADRPDMTFDALSIGIGSVPSTCDVLLNSDRVIRIKPMQTFLPRLSAAVTEHRPAEDRSMRIVVVGSGVAGLEVAFCLIPFLQRHGVVAPEIQLVTRSEQVADGVTDSMRRRIIRRLEDRSIEVRNGQTVQSVIGSDVVLKGGRQLSVDLVIWATGASPPPLIEQLNLPTDERGFLSTDATLRSTSGQPIFAVGDCGSMMGQPLPKAGVYAVRQGPVLWHNLQATLNHQPLISYQAQSTFLKLLNTGDGQAIGEWKGLSFSGAWVMNLKNRIDLGFIRKFRTPDSNPSETPMQCTGCGCKLSSDVLLASLRSGTEEIAVEDAAVMPTDAGTIVASTDFFALPFNDPWLNGRVTALHSASDLTAMNCAPKAALANVVLPGGSPEHQRSALKEFLQGASLELQAMNARLVGGHTIVGPRWEAGFTVIGTASPDVRLLQKNQLQSGDLLFLTKPLGSGILLAAHHQGQCRSDWYESLLNVLLQRQDGWRAVISDCQLQAGTDVTGFGLAGHLLEMLTASRVHGRISLNAIPCMNGVQELVERGFESSLAPDNRAVRRQIDVSPDIADQWKFATIFDPQTCGGLLLAVRPEVADRFLKSAVEHHLATPVQIGEVTPYRTETPELNVVS